MKVTAVLWLALTDAQVCLYLLSGRTATCWGQCAPPFLFQSAFLVLHVGMCFACWLSLSAILLPLRMNSASASLAIGSCRVQEPLAVVLLLGSHNTVPVSWCTPAYTFWSGILQIPDVLGLLNFWSFHFKVGLGNSFLTPHTLTLSFCCFLVYQFCTHLFLYPRVL